MLSPEALKTAVMQALRSTTPKTVHDERLLKQLTTRDPLGPMMYAEEER
jgi:hypothetical protein